jgi:N-formylglutamate deformylase
MAAPLVLDSPHSGSRYPKDFGHACPRSWLRESEDAFVDELFGDAPALGAPLLSAQFARCYIDPNRAEDDIDPQLLETPWPGGAKPTARSDLGMGLMRRLYKSSRPEPIYDRFLTHAEIRNRINNYYRPYHEALESLLEETYSAFGCVWHLNCHSMPGPSTTADIVLGDRDGESCAAGFTRHVASALRKMGYSVAINRPYKGVELVRKWSDPGKNRHSLQIEVKRTLYMDEQTRRKSPGFEGTRRNMRLLINHLIDYTQQNMATLAAE